MLTSCRRGVLQRADEVELRWHCHLGAAPDSEFFDHVGALLSGAVPHTPPARILRDRKLPADVVPLIAPLADQHPAQNAIGLGIASVEFERAICTMALEYAPRTQSIYSDLGFILLAFILEDAYRAPFGVRHEGGQLLEPAELAKNIVDAAADKKASDIALLDIRELSVIADYFVICTGTNPRQIGAIVSAIDDKLAEVGVR